MSLIDDLQELRQEARELIANADSAEKLEAARVAMLGRKGKLTLAMKGMGKLDPQLRRSSALTRAENSITPKGLAM